MRAAKGTPYEGGIRVPMFVKWPGKTNAGEISNSPVTSLDITATSIAMAGGDPRAAGLHGKDIRPFLSGQSKEPPHDVLYWYTAQNMSPQGVIRDGDFKLIIGPKKVELYNLKDDLGETKNLAADYPEKIKAMRARWMTWAEDRKPPLWSGGKNIQFADYDWLKGSPHYKANSNDN